MKLTPNEMVELLKGYGNNVECDDINCEDCPLDKVCEALDEIGDKLNGNEPASEEEPTPEEEEETPVDVFEAVDLLEKVRTSDCGGLSCRECPLSCNVKIDDRGYTCLSLAIADMTRDALNRKNMLRG